MTGRRHLLAGVAALSALLAIASAPTAVAAEDNDSRQAGTMAVMGDLPYGATKLANLPTLIDAVNADPTVDLVAHLGDIKAGTDSPCTDAYFQQIHDSFNRFDDPLVYTPGDNEWTDCHVAFKNNGLFTPTERLQAVRSLFFPVPGQTLGVHERFVLSQSIDPRNRAYVENVLFVRSRVVFAALNVTGSNDDLAPWGTPLPDDSANFPSQAQERASRLQANLAWLHDAFLAATVTHAPGIVLMMQADMWDATAKLNGFDEMVRQIGVEALRFRQPVLVLEGDSHVFRVDHPYTTATATDQALFQLHPDTPVAPNVTRLVVEGSNTVPTRFEYVRLAVRPGSAQLFSWDRVDVPFA